VAWAPEFFEFPAWAAGVDLMFADAAGWARPIRFAHRADGHAAAIDVARQAITHRVHRLVFAHIRRPTTAAIDAGLVPPFGEFGSDRASTRSPGTQQLGAIPSHAGCASASLPGHHGGHLLMEGMPRWVTTSRAVPVAKSG
jgi:hypothetical protein